MTVSLNYRAQFQRNETLAKAHRELVVTEAFQVAVEMALLHYQSEVNLTNTDDPNANACRNQRTLGAQQFVNILLNLAEAPPLPIKKPTTGIDYGR
jgi:hypothetical protein